MALRDKIKIAVAAWVVAEFIALVIAVRVLGWPATLLLGFLTSAIGFYVLKQAGRDSLAFLRGAMQRTSTTVVEAPTSGLLRVASGLLLLLPGFLSNLIGAFLLAPQMRALVIRRFAPVTASAPDGVVDLAPDEWRAARPQEPGAPCEPLPGVLPGGPKSAAAIRRPDDE